MVSCEVISCADCGPEMVCVSEVTCGEFERVDSHKIIGNALLYGTMLFLATPTSLVQSNAQSELAVQPSSPAKMRTLSRGRRGAHFVTRAILDEAFFRRRGIRARFDVTLTGLRSDIYLGILLYPQGSNHALSTGTFRESDAISVRELAAMR